MIDSSDKTHARNEHSVLVNFLALVAWVEGVECVVVEAHQLRDYFELTRLEDPRVQTLIDTAQPLFPHCKTLYEVPDQHTNLTLYLSRRRLPKAVFEIGTQKTETRVRLLSKIMRTVIVDLPAKDDIVDSLSDLAEGIVFAQP